MDKVDRYRQPKAGTTETSRCAAISLLKGFKESLFEIRANANTGIPNAEGDAIADRTFDLFDF